MEKFWRLGTIISADVLAEGVAFCRQAGLDTLQLRTGDASLRPREQMEALRPLLKEFPADTLAAGWSGPAKWNFREGPATLGVGPKETRAARMQSLLTAAEYAALLEIPLMQTHFGFVPENPGDPEYAEHVECLRIIGRRCGELGVRFCLETGQETPITLRRLIEDAGEKAVAVNLDPANLLMYGKANPLDAVDILGKHIASMHLKDGLYPGEDSYALGRETRIGEGRVDFAGIFRKLHALGFNGPLIIEREIGGEQQRIDLCESIPKFKQWMAQA